MENDRKKYIIFGCGKIGREALSYLGEDNVYCFADNNLSICGTNVYGKEVLSFRALEEICKDYSIVIATNISHAYEIKEQLEKNGIYDYQFFKYMKENRNYWREEYESIKKQMNALSEQYKKGFIHVEFYLVDAFEISHFKPLYELFRINGIHAVFVAENPLHNTTHDWFDYEEAVRILENQNLEYRNQCNVDAHLVFTTQDAYVLGKYKNAVKINMTYGFAANERTYEFSERAMRGFDYKFVHGSLIQEKCIEKGILDKGHIKIMGYPRYYELIGKLWDREKILKELGINTAKPIIGYFPTWDEDASIMAFKDAIKELKKDFFIVTKSHHCTYRLKEKRHELETLYDISDMVLDGNYEFDKAAMIGDLNLCDAKSGAALETCLINGKAKAVFLSVREENYFMDELYELAPVINQPDKLRAAIDRIMNEDQYQSIREERMDRYFDRTVDKQKLWNILKSIIDVILEKNEGDIIK